MPLACPDSYKREFTKALGDWYRLHRRSLPWRENPDPYRVWVSEVMLQQTRVDTVLRYYLPFLERFPDVASLAAAESGAVLKAWEGLGFYQRATRMHQAARIVTAHHGERLPDTPEALSALPGFGPYMTGAVLSIGFGQRVPAVDGNIERILARLFRIRLRNATPSGRRVYRERLLALLPDTGAGDSLQALMDIGATICLRKPDCPACPLNRLCRTAGRSHFDRYPAPSGSSRPRNIDRVVLLDLRDGGVLVVQRPEGGLLGGLWEFPGVDAVDPGAAKGEFIRQYGLHVDFDRRCMEYEHVFSHIRWRVQVWTGTAAAGCAEMRRAGPVELGELPIPTAYRPIRRWLDRHARTGDIT